MTTISTDSRSRVVLPGRPNEMFTVQENSDGSLLLQPAVVVSRAQLEYDQSSELQQLLQSAASSPTVQRARRSTR